MILHMPTDPYDLVEKAIDEGQKLEADYIEARLVSTNANTSILKNGVPELGGIIRSKGIGIRVLKDGGVGFASFNEMTKDEMNIALWKCGSSSLNTLIMPVKNTTRKLSIKNFVKL